MVPPTEAPEELTANPLANVSVTVALGASEGPSLVTMIV